MFVSIINDSYLQIYTQNTQLVNLKDENLLC